MLTSTIVGAQVCFVRDATNWYYSSSFCQTKQLGFCCVKFGFAIVLLLEALR